MSVTGGSSTGSTIAGVDTGRPARISLGTRNALTGIAFISPWIVGFLLFTALPMAASFVLSMTDFDPRAPGDTTFIGLDNYREMLGDERLLHSLWITVRLGLILVPATMLFALGVALLVNHALLRGRSVFRTLFYMPMQIPIVASTLVWLGVLNASNGWLNMGLGAVGITGPDWINSAAWVAPSLTLMGLWGIGNMMLIFLAGLQGVPTELYDAAKADGAGPFSTFRHVTLPMISTVIFYNLIIALIGTFQYFTQAYIIGNGRGDPANETLFYNLNLYLEGWSFFRMGYASALAWLLFVIVLGLTLLLFRAARSFVYEAGGDR
jgi:ABC-type sugar transport system permease subunit